MSLWVRNPGWTQCEDSVMGHWLLPFRNSIQLNSQLGWKTQDGFPHLSAASLGSFCLVLQGLSLQASSPSSRIAQVLSMVAASPK